MYFKDQKYDLLEKRVKKQGFLLKLSFFVWVITLGLLLFPNFYKSEAQKTEVISSLRVSELIVVDAKGVERVRVAGDIPDAIINGKKVNRGEKVAGVMLYDGTGQERGGYVTFEPSGNIGLTLDTRKGQVALFAAGPDEGSVIQLWNNKDSLEIRSDSEGTRLTTVRDGQVISQEPQIKKMAAETCQEYSSAKGKLSNEQILNECRRRYTKSVCQACLGNK